MTMPGDMLFPFLFSLMVVHHVTPTALSFRHMIGFMGNKHGGDTILEITILNPNTNITTVSISVSHNTATGVGIGHYAGGVIYMYPGEMQTLTLPPVLAVNGSVKCEKGIRIDSDHPTFVYGNNRQQSHTSMDEFLSIPRRELGNLYYVITGRKRPQLLVVGLYANTSLNITVRATSGASYQNESYRSGQTLYETMKEYDTIQIVSEKLDNDFTGTEIKSSKPVSVFSGSRFSESSHLAEQIPTVANWGEHHVTAPPAEDFLYNTTIVAAFPNTLLNFSCSDGTEKLLTLAEAGSFQNMRPSNATCLISTTRPVLVSIAIYGFTVDTSMTTIQPMQRVLGDLMFLAPDNVYRFNLVVVTYCNSSLTLDKGSLGTMKVDGDSGICIGRASIETGIHTIRSSGHDFFISGYIYGTQSINSIAFPLVPNCDELGGQQAPEDGETSTISSDNTKATVTRIQYGQNVPSLSVPESPPQSSTPFTSVSEATTNNKSRVGLDGLCKCTCSETHKDIDSALATMRTELSIFRNMTNKHVRSRTSASDDRTSSRMIGLTASVFIGVLILTVLILDIDHLVQMVRRIKRCSLLH